MYKLKMALNLVKKYLKYSDLLPGLESNLALADFPENFKERTINLQQSLI